MELKHAILGLLSIQPTSGYDLGRAFEGSVAHFWYADQSQIYRTLDRLAQNEAIATTVIPQDGKPDRKVHSLTDIGRQELTDWLTSPLEDQRPKEPFLARVFFAAQLGVEGVEKLLDQHERDADAALERYQAISTHTETLEAALQAATLRSGIAHAKAEKAWIQETRDLIRNIATQ